ncbi:GyrI-like domain-containing protein [Georgenia sp. SYP-B2076]|uniref:GyrI-like domain-containing protein n=1 Tax=Georgenia sp. SYP-B2076 TaxID=2495881 RepID=UPI0013DE9FFC|nr:GyrI-like domain-containing protein [Georgenia sp. SYP-B2076]
MEEIRIIELEEQVTAGVRQIARMDDLTTLFDAKFAEVAQALQASGVTPAGAPYARYRGRPSETVDVEIGFPVAEAFAATGDLVVDALPAVRAVETFHVGSYDKLHETYERVDSWIAEHQLQTLEDMWEVYESGPESDPDPATWRTRILLPLTGPQVEKAP